ncbi:MAG: phosphoribosylformylglycinamidine synthase subunit PurS [Elusimicrobiota bacterium]
MAGNLEKEYFFEISLKGRDAIGREIEEGVRDLGIDGIDAVAASRIFYLYGELDESRKEQDLIAKELLSDPLCESYSLLPVESDGAEIKVFFKEGVLDIESVRVCEALHIMGIDSIKKVRTARKYIIKGGNASDSGICRFIAEKLLYNKVIEEARIDAE